MGKVYVVHHELYSNRKRTDDMAAYIVAYRPMCMFGTLGEAKKYIDAHAERRAKVEAIPNCINAVEGEDSYRAWLDELPHVQWVAHPVSNAV